MTEEEQIIKYCKHCGAALTTSSNLCDGCISEALTAKLQMHTISCRECGEQFDSPYVETDELCDVCTKEANVCGQLDRVQKISIDHRRK